MSALSSSPHGESLGHLLITAPQTTSPRLSWSFSYFLLPGTPGWDRKASLPVHTPPPPSHRPIRDDEKQAMRWFAMLVMLDHPDSRQMSGQGNQHLNTQCTRPVPTPSDLRGSFGKAAAATDRQCEAEFPISRRHGFFRMAVGVGNQSALPVQAFKQWLTLVLYRGVSKLDFFNA